MAYKYLSAEEYAQADAGLREARLALQDREEKLMAVYNQVETGMSLIGATAVEDRWVLTRHNHTAVPDEPAEKSLNIVRSVTLLMSSFSSPLSH